MRAKGGDISKYQAPQDLSMVHGIDFDVMLDKLDFLWVRAGYAGSSGSVNVDERFLAYMADLGPKLKARPGYPFGLYWFFRDDVSVSGQASKFAMLVNQYKHVINMPLCTDAEVFVKDRALSTQKLKDFQTEVERMTGLKCDVLYGRGGQLNAETDPGLPSVYPYLFVARYIEVTDLEKAEPWIEGGPQEYVEPRDWDEWKFWQWTSSGVSSYYGVGRYGSKGFDLDLYNGTLEELKEWAGITTPPPPPPPPPPPDDGDEEIDFSSAVTSARLKLDNRTRTAVFRPPGDDKGIRPYFASLGFAKGVVDRVNVYVCVNGASFQIATKPAKYYNFAFFEYPPVWLDPVNQDNYVWFEVIPAVVVSVTVDIAVCWG